LDTSGREVIRVNFREERAEVVAENELQAKADRYYYRDAMKLEPGEVFVSEFDLNVEHGQIERPLEPVLRLLAPVVDEAGSTRGLLALNYSGDHLLRRLNKLSLPGSTLLINSAGQYIRGPRPDDAWGWLLGQSRSFPKHFPTAWQQINDESEGQFLTGEGMFTFRRVWLSESPTFPGREIQANELAALILIAFVPPNLHYTASTKLLKQLLWMYAGAMILITTVGWYWARSAAIRRQQAKSIVASEVRLRTLSNELLTAQEEERRSISRELHDELGQQVTAISLNLRSAARQQDAASAASLLERAIEETDHLLQAVHEVASRVRPSVLDDLGLHDAVESLTSEHSQRSGVTINMKLDFDEQCVSRKIGENVYRILQEGLTNVVKHAETEQVSVTIELESNQLLMTLEDHGMGFDSYQRDNSRLGIIGMQERVELLGGRFTLSTRRGAGTRIDVSIPMQNGTK
jgi:signal transduction histidine kinase